MKKIADWWVPDQENFHKVVKTIHSQEWTCREPIEIALQYVKRFGQAIDVGTWIGDSTVLLSQQFSQVIGFEASPAVYECCVENIKHRQLNHVKLHNVALSSMNQTQTFINRLSTFSGWVDTKNISELGEHEVSFQVQANTLDSFGFKDVDFLKLDVDSHEGFVLVGASDFFANNNPVILIENKPSVLNRQAEHMPNAFELLKSFGYKMQQQVGKIDFIWIRN
jgi:FkbM family methyltransferase